MREKKEKTRKKRDTFHDGLMMYRFQFEEPHTTTQSPPVPLEIGIITGLFFIGVMTW